MKASLFSNEYYFFSFGYFFSQGYFSVEKKNTFMQPVQQAV